MDPDAENDLLLKGVIARITHGPIRVSCRRKNQDLFQITNLMHNSFIL